MRTEATPRNATDSLDLYFYLDSSDAQIYVFTFYFAEVRKLAANERRSFNISVNGNYWIGPSPPTYNHTATCTFLSSDLPTRVNEYRFSLYPTEFSTLPPIINAIEIYLAKDFSQPQTDKDQDYVKFHKESSDQTGSQLESKRRRYSFNEVSNMTNNFERILGRGGFGTVYYGIIDDIQVAVKMLSQSSVQGYQQFLAEHTCNDFIAGTPGYLDPEY
ncbi:hypothetical protein PIB30_036436 [Stylosanthes scabra]|uniref:Malectin-like domain-containing protein n=1 Tax=Stylosanthes scabra TaxID=79078 RepID=A0ABU6TD55_9FABA|nr:hypothetical protein [Stylosanthes scabra]